MELPLQLAWCLCALSTAIEAKIPFLISFSGLMQLTVVTTVHTYIVLNIITTILPCVYRFHRSTPTKLFVSVHTVVTIGAASCCPSMIYEHRLNVHINHSSCLHLQCELIFVSLHVLARSRDSALLPLSPHKDSYQTETRMCTTYN